MLEKVKHFKMNRQFQIEFTVTEALWKKLGRRRNWYGIRKGTKISDQYYDHNIVNDVVYY